MQGRCFPCPGVAPNGPIPQTDAVRARGGGASAPPPRRSASFAGPRPGGSSGPVELRRYFSPAGLDGADLAELGRALDVHAALRAVALELTRSGVHTGLFACPRRLVIVLMHVLMLPRPDCLVTSAVECTPRPAAFTPSVPQQICPIDGLTRTDDVAKRDNAAAAPAGGRRRRYQVCGTDARRPPSTCGRASANLST